MQLIELCQYTLRNSLQDMNYPLKEETAQEVLEASHSTKLLWR